MAHYKLIIAYDGTDFQGFQRQAGDARTVQAALEGALERLGWDGGAVQAAGRTDAGVHAQGQVVAFDLSWGHSPASLVAALNAQLPGDVSVLEASPAPEGFHPRFSASRRRYRYTVIAAERRNPLRERYAWRIWPAPDMGRLTETASLFVGEHDFAPFGSAPRPGGHTVRKVFRAEWRAAGDEYTFRIEADAFLYRMVRKLVAACVEAGQGRSDRAAVQELLTDPALRWEGHLAPARGLCLEAVIYERGAAGLEALGDDEGESSGR